MGIKDNQPSFRPIVGIDLGTTNSAIAFVRRGKPEIIPSLRGERIIPSVVLIDMQQKVVVGEDARASLVAMPERTVSAVKRKMGSTERVPIADQELLPEEISALILKELKSYADAELGEGEKEAVITVPAYFTDEQRRATKLAGELAGFVVERIINEPTAAALAYGLNHLDNDHHIFVYDLGGGTFDVSVCELMSGIVEVKASKGNRELGGEDFDWRLVDWLAEQIESEHGVDPRQDLRARALLKEEAERVKKQLSFEEAVAVSLPVVTVVDNQPVGLNLTVTRAQFESFIEKLLLETMEISRQVLADANLTAADMDEVLLVGGSTRIPRVQALLQEFFGKSARIDVDPDEAVALGAAVQAGIKSGALTDSGLIVTDVAPFSMGLSVVQPDRHGHWQEGVFSVVIPRNTTIPTVRTNRYYTAYLGQTEVRIEIYQGEDDWVQNNHLLGKFILSGIPVSKNDHEPILVEFRYNLNGILEVAAKVEATGKEMSVTVQDALKRDSEEEYEESVRRLESLWENKDDEDEEENEEWGDEEEIEELFGQEGFDWDDEVDPDEFFGQAETDVDDDEEDRD